MPTHHLACLVFHAHTPSRFLNFFTLRGLSLNALSSLFLGHTDVQAGADLSRVVIAHIDRTIFSPATLTRLAATGVVIELDLFGNEVR